MHDALPTNTLATIGRRAAAWLLDGIVLVPVWLLLIAAFGGGSSADPLNIPQGAVRVFWLVLVAYHIGFIAHGGQTIGKRWVGIRVADAVTGAVPDLDQAARRAAPTLIQIVPVLGLFAVFLYLPALWRPRRQGLHDVLAGTVVVRV